MEFGNSTDEAVLNGSIASLVALVEKYSRRLQQTAGQAKLFLSGGDAAVMAKFIDYEDSEIIPGLVLDGLAIACPSQKESPA
jgi:pantothenate kinase type III